MTCARGAFSPLIMIALVLVGAFAFAAFFTLSAFEPELNSGRNGGAHALSQSAVGFAGAVQFARARGDEVSVGRTIGDMSRLDGLVVLTPQHALDETQLEETSGWSTLVILPKWMTTPDPTHRGWVRSAGALDPRWPAAMLRNIAPDVTVDQEIGAFTPQLQAGKRGQLTAGSIENFQTISGPNLTPVVVDQNGRIVLARVQHEGVAPFYILSDPDFLNTQGLHDIHTARAGMVMLDLTRRPDDPIIFDVTLNGLGAARNALRLAFEPPFLGATLGLVATALLLGWRAAARFGPSVPARRAIALGKAALADNSAALIRLANREKHMGQGYARLIAGQIAERFAGDRKDDAALTSWLDRLGATHGVTPPFSALLNAAANAKSRPDMLDAARKLHAWKEEMKRATR